MREWERVFIPGRQTYEYRVGDVTIRVCREGAHWHLSAPPFTSEVCILNRMTLREAQDAAVATIYGRIRDTLSAFEQCDGRAVHVGVHADDEADLRAYAKLLASIRIADR